MKKIFPFLDLLVTALFAALAGGVVSAMRYGYAPPTLPVVLTFTVLVGYVSVRSVEWIFDTVHAIYCIATSSKIPLFLPEVTIAGGSSTLVTIVVPGPVQPLNLEIADAKNASEIYVDMITIGGKNLLRTKSVLLSELSPLVFLQSGVVASPGRNILLTLRNSGAAAFHLFGKLWARRVKKVPSCSTCGSL